MTYRNRLMAAVGCGLLIGCTWLAQTAPAAETSGLAWDESSDPGALVLTEDGRPVLAYVYQDRVPDGVDSKYARSCYVHPLYDLDGKSLTDDFPTDHYHHRGMWWSWPRMKVDGRDVQTWHPSPLRQRFVKWLRRDIDDDTATLSARNEWVLDGRRVGLETTTFTIQTATDSRRMIDVSLTFEAVGGPVELLGAAGKGYGGLTLRLNPSFQGGTLTTDQGKLAKDSTVTPYRWADLSAHGHGVTVTAADDHPDAPIGWLLRTSYAGIINAAWPGLTPVTLQPGAPVTLTYQIVVHRTP